jgi:beta-glucanase (GH16 family)
MISLRGRILASVVALAMTMLVSPSYSPISAQRIRLDASMRPLASQRAAKTIKWGKPVFATTFKGTKLDTKHWSVYDDPTGKLSGWRRTVQSVRVKHGLLELIGHYQKPYGYVGGGLAYNFNRTYGRWVIRFRADRGAGYEPVVLLWPQGTWPDDGEIDMAEIYNSRRLGAGEFLHIGKDNSFLSHPIPRSVDFSKWHTLSVDWLPGHITFWLGGKKLWTVERKPGKRDYIPSTPFHLAMQIDAGCADHKCKPNKSTPKRTRMQVDWVRIYALPPRAR